MKLHLNMYTLCSSIPLLLFAITPRTDAQFYFNYKTYMNDSCRSVY